MLKKILMVCVGNICRSPAAAIMLLGKIKQTVPEVQINSAGLAALIDQPADIVMQNLMEEKGLDLSNHRACQLTINHLLEADLILTMDQKQCLQVEQMLSGTKGRVHRLGKWSGFDIPDPYQRPMLVFNQVVALIDQGLDDWQKRLWN